MIHLAALRDIGVHHVQFPEARVQQTCFIWRTLVVEPEARLVGLFLRK